MPKSPPQHRPAYMPSREAVTRLNRQDYNRHSRKNQAFYDSRAWRRLSRYFRKRNPFCIRCKAKGIATAVQLVDHVVAIEDGGAPLDEDNLQSLCISCHNTKTAKERK